MPTCVAMKSMSVIPAASKPRTRRTRMLLIRSRISAQFTHPEPAQLRIGQHGRCELGAVGGWV